jgi:hypothetical protein
MRTAKTVAIYVVGITLTIEAQQAANISVRELPPEQIPRGTCTESFSGYLGIEGGGGEQSRFNPSEQEIGRYIAKRMRQGYSLWLYPQASGRIFSIARCEATNPSVPSAPLR